MIRRYLYPATSLTGDLLPCFSRPTEPSRLSGVRERVSLLEVWKRRSRMLSWSASFGSSISVIGLEVQESTCSENPAAGRKLAACEDAERRFLPDYANLRLEGEDSPQLWINRNSTPIPVQQLSDGERGILAIVLDLTRRLAQANPNFTDPASEAEAVVLIDELDLHLHPKWQRQIAHNLTTTFPQCQFIATTHSPQVIGEVPHERIHIISDDEVYSPTHSFGVDSSRVLEEIMDADPRSAKVKELLSNVSQVIGKEQFNQARSLVEQLVAHLGRSGSRGDAVANPSRLPRGRRMRTILKGAEPRSLTEHRAKTHSNYDNYTDKDGFGKCWRENSEGYAATA